MKKILCFGDSNTWGHNPVNCSRLERRWPVILDEMLDGCEIIQDGVCGRATRLRVSDEWDKDALKVFRKRYLENNDFDLIIIMLGTNDLLNENDFTAEETAEALCTMIDEARERFSQDKPQFLLIAPILISADAMKHPIFSTLYSEKSVINSGRFAGVIAEAAKREGVHFFNASSVSSPSPVDGVHMDSDNHAKLATAVADKIKSIFGEDNL